MPKSRSAVVEFPVPILLKHHNPLTDSGWGCYGMKDEMFTNLSHDFILENQGDKDYVTVLETRINGVILDTPPEYDEDGEEIYDDEEMFDIGEGMDFCPTSLYDYHLARVAYLIENFDNSPISISIRENQGLFVPMLVDGNHRLLAHKCLGLPTIKAIVSDCPEEMEIDQLISKLDTGVDEEFAFPD